MTKEEAIKHLDSLCDDEEFAHIGADKIIIQYLRDNDEDIALAWDRALKRAGGEFWYT